jgi:hypothetical protein
MITLQDVKRAQEGKNWKPYVVQSPRGKKIHDCQMFFRGINKFIFKLPCVPITMYWKCLTKSWMQCLRVVGVTIIFILHFRIVFKNLNWICTNSMQDFCYTFKRSYLVRISPRLSQSWVHHKELKVFNLTKE